MKRYEYTVHAEQKLKLPLSIKLGITRKKIQNIVKKPKVLDKSDDPVYIAISDLNETLSLCVAYRTKDDGIIRVITFYPAEKGRYERKILPG